MMHDFLTNNRAELIGRCRKKVSLRPRHQATADQLVDGVPLFLDQLTRTLEAELSDATATSVRISGASDGTSTAQSEIERGSAEHGKALHALGYTVDQVVHDYGDVCQAITELAFERDAPFAVEEFRTLNRCLDNAIAGAVTAFSVRRDSRIDLQRSSECRARLHFLAHGLVETLQTANLAVRAMEVGGLTLVGATGSVLKRSLASIRSQVDRTIAEGEDGEFDGPIDQPRATGGSK